LTARVAYLHPISPLTSPTLTRNHDLQRRSTSETDRQTGGQTDGRTDGRRRIQRADVTDAATYVNGRAQTTMQRDRPSTYNQPSWYSVVHLLVIILHSDHHSTSCSITLSWYSTCVRYRHTQHCMSTVFGERLYAVRHLHSYNTLCLHCNTGKRLSA